MGLLVVTPTNWSMWLSLGRRGGRHTTYCQTLDVQHRRGPACLGSLIGGLFPTPPHSLVRMGLCFRGRFPRQGALQPGLCTCRPAVPPFNFRRPCAHGLSMSNTLNCVCQALARRMAAVVPQCATRVASSLGWCRAPDRRCWMALSGSLIFQGAASSGVHRCS